MQVRGWCDAGPRMLQGRSPDVQVLKIVEESMSLFGKNQRHRLNMWAIFQPLKSFHF